jgi:hypothetical protein
MTKRGNSANGVGYRRPPRATQFKPGQSGNAKGRPKGSKNLSTCIQKELRKRVYLTEDGKRKRTTKAQAFATRIVNEGLAGDLKVAAPHLMKAAGGEDRDPHAGRAQDVLGGPADELVMASIIRRIRSMDEPPDEETEDLPEPPKQPKTPSTEED